MKKLNLLAFDLGASSGRAVLGRFDGSCLITEEVYRFNNGFYKEGGVLYWDTTRLLNEIKTGFAAAKASLDCFGIDTWGVDYGFIGRDGRLIENPRCYRGSEDREMETAWKVASREYLFFRTGCAANNFNTVYQLYKRVLENDTALKRADKLLLMPDLLGYMLTGEAATEYTNATTTNLYNPTLKNWDYDIINALNMPGHIFTDIQPSGTMRGRLLPSIAENLGIKPIPFAAVGTHDTASAVAAIPGSGNFAFCSSGTWSLIGVETNSPVLSDEVYKANLSNEGTVQGTFRPLKNIMGLWIIQECQCEWNNISWDEITAAAGKEQPFRSLIDPGWPPFFSVGEMAAKISRFCEITNQPPPETIGQYARCIYESLALAYNRSLTQLSKIKGTAIDSLNIVGGGSKNKLLNQMCADACGVPVIAGPAECSAIGNLLMQATALDELGGIGELREVVRRSFDTVTYEPQNAECWTEAQERFTKLTEILRDKVEY
jgi:sugar (pentulose or hexulose) kinase